jgi:hypothetical protein
MDLFHYRHCGHYRYSCRDDINACEPSIWQNILVCRYWWLPCFFLYQFKVLSNRSEAIKRQDIVKKFHQKAPLSNEDYDLVRVIVCHLSSNKERINYFVIFALSAIALTIGVYIDFIM